MEGTCFKIVIESFQSWLWLQTMADIHKNSILGHDAYPEIDDAQSKLW